jgi:hypothetical protein
MVATRGARDSDVFTKGDLVSDRGETRGILRRSSDSIDIPLAPPVYPRVDRTQPARAGKKRRNWDAIDLSSHRREQKRMELL